MRNVLILAAALIGFAAVSLPAEASSPLDPAIFSRMMPAPRHSCNEPRYYSSKQCAEYRRRMEYESRRRHEMERRRHAEMRQDRHEQSRDTRMQERRQDPGPRREATPFPQSEERLVNIKTPCPKGQTPVKGEFVQDNPDGTKRYKVSCK